MKKFKYLVLFALLLVAIFAFTACAGGYSNAGDYYPSGGVPDGVTGGDTAEDYSSGEGSGSDTSQQKKPAGLMTAGAWNDNDNYALWKTLFEQGVEANGKFFEYYGKNGWGFNSYNRVKVTVKNGDKAVSGARVCAYSEGQSAVFSAVTDACGVAYLFTEEANGSITVESGEYLTTAEFAQDNRDIDVVLDGSAVKMNVVELMFVVDVTGSMGDEIYYLKNELTDVIERIALSDSQIQINLAFLFYRDHGDNEVFKYYDFKNVTESEGLAAQQSALDKQNAWGGGDIPEAVDEALLLATEKSWSDAATTKIIFHVLDAPPHGTETNKDRFKSATLLAAEKGIRICPVICSGADTLTEYLMRQVAIYTGGTFVFVTDDSGIGNAHHDPQLPNVTVEALNSLIVRLVKGYHTGTFEPPVYWREEVNYNK